MPAGLLLPNKLPPSIQVAAGFPGAARGSAASGRAGGGRRERGEGMITAPLHLAAAAIALAIAPSTTSSVVAATSYNPPVARSSSAPPYELGMPSCSLAMTWSTVNDAAFWRGGNSLSVAIIFATYACAGTMIHAWSISQS